MLKQRYMIPLIVFFILPCVAWSSDVYLDEIIVTATRTEQVLRNVPMTVSVLTRDDLEVSNINSATDILSTLPGVFVWKTSSCTTDKFFSHLKVCFCSTLRAPRQG